MGQGSSNPLRENIESLHSQLMRHAGADYDIATTTTLTYDQFLSYITQLNQICREYKDSENHVLVFAVKKGTDSTIFWKATVRIACVKLNIATNKVLSYRLLNIRQFLQVFRRITYECTGGLLGEVDGQDVNDSSDVVGDLHTTTTTTVPVPPTMAASMILGRMQELPTSSTASLSHSGLESSGASASCGTNLEECVICLERRPDVILPCAHAYCLPCIEQWWEYSNPSEECNSTHVVFSMTVVDKTCPVCRESLKSTDDTWVLSEVPDDDQVNEEIRRALIGLAGDKVESPT